MQKRILCLMVLLLLIGSVAFSQTLNWSTYKPTKQITIDVMNDLGPGTKPPANDVVTPVLRQKTGVTANIIASPQGFSGDDATTSALIAANNLPDIISESYLAPKAIVQQLLIESDAVWNFTDEAMLRKYFPNLTKRVDQWGDLKIWWENCTSYGGTHVNISSSSPWQGFPKLVKAVKGTTFALKTSHGGILGYSKWMRDDILKKIYPTARTAAQQEQFFIKTFSYTAPLTTDPYGDIPIKSIEDFYNYMKKAKELIDRENIKDGLGKDKMIVAQIDYFIGWAAGLWPTNLSMYGYWWREPWNWVVADKSYYGTAQPWTKDAMRWMNKWYNEGLLDPELYVKQGAQAIQEAVAGRYAIFPNWGGFDVAAANQFSKDKKLGYGYRNLLTWWPRTFKGTYNDSSNRWVSYYNRFAGNLITKNVKEEDLAQVTNWLDYHMSEEYDILKSWGPPEFYTGTGKDRRYKPAYKELENFQAYGGIGGKDGYYYNIKWNSPVSLDNAARHYETEIGQLMAYYLAPQFVYPLTKKAGMNYEAEMQAALVAFLTQRDVNLIPQTGWNDFDLTGLPNFSKIEYIWTTQATEVARAVVDTPANFDKNYALYLKTYRDPEVVAALQDVEIKWKEIFDANLKKYWKY